mmetsp:Transcript_9764/g.39669  ORF Transcript_9764/g.39669 Transcript_9764/m.39669 type:complete len:237 (+) Transcript_9764:986-1696(+)
MLVDAEDGDGKLGRLGCGEGGGEAAGGVADDGAAARVVHHQAARLQRISDADDAGGDSVVVTEESDLCGGVGADEGHGRVGGGKGQEAGAVLQEDHRLARSLQGKRLVLGSVHRVHAQPLVGNLGWRVEEAQLEARPQHACKGSTQLLLLECAVLDGLGALGIVLSTVEVATTFDGNLAGVPHVVCIVVGVLDVADCATVADDVTFEAPLAARHHLLQQGVRARGHAVHLVVGAHN